MKRNGLEKEQKEMDEYKKEIDGQGTILWTKNGELHRDDDLPAVEYEYGTKLWYKDGVKHRDNDLPAVEHADGTKERTWQRLTRKRPKRLLFC